MFSPVEKLSKQEAVKQIFNIDYGTKGSNVVADNNGTSSERRRSSDKNSTDREQTSEGGQSTDNWGRDRSDEEKVEGSKSEAEPPQQKADDKEGGSLFRKDIFEIAREVAERKREEDRAKRHYIAEDVANKLGLKINIVDSADKYLQLSKKRLMLLKKTTVSALSFISRVSGQTEAVHLSARSAAHNNVPFKVPFFSK